MRRKLVLSIALAVIVIGTGFTFAYSNEQPNRKAQKQQEVEQNVNNKQATPKSSYVVTNEQLDKAARDVGAILDEKTLYFRMMEMIFQKITINENNLVIPNTRNPGRVQMTKENIQYLKNQIAIVGGEKKERYNAVLDKWYNEDFDTVIEDYKEIYNLYYGKSMKTNLRFTKKTDNDERDYVIQFFGQEGLNIHNEEWEHKL
ncbi:DUF6241 domain-containing protein [Ectobacillus panaciterrae]|uniref:DUF6241 domain-containing protein n=1 Tax=Ectobacillus panaciterrae TaxID=363872 RepID=UPI0003FB6B9A|nr:DUF6241 domain-containing protein [Ectobacillus panaciterrae]